ncbi:ABC transporter ATP-binding protein/permease [Patescibacteria group bacterium]|nr:ABC transporter ATP-binding protein/permease [Patescibacteria group bacterium]
MKNPITGLFRTMWHYAKGRRRLVVLTIVLQGIATAIMMVQPYIIGRAFNYVQTAESYTYDVFKVLALYLSTLVLMTTLTWCFWGIARVIENVTAFHIKNTYVLDMLGIILNLPLWWHQENHSGKSIAKINRAASALQSFSSSLFEIVESVIRLLAAFIALALIDIFSGGIALLVSVIAIALVVLVDQVITKILKRIYAYDNKTASAVHDFVSNITTVISLKLQKYALTEVGKRLRKPFTLYKREKKISEGKWAVVDHLVKIMAVGVLIVYAYSVLKRGEILLLGTFVMLYEYLRQVGDVFYTTAWRYSTMVEEYAEVTAASSIKNAKRYIDTDTKETQLLGSWEKIALKKVTFVYKSANKKDQKKQTAGLHDIDFALNRGEKIALVGTSGSGKSTMLSIMKGLYNPQLGSVIVDERKESFKTLANSVALIPQDPEIFQNTVKYNIALGKNISNQKIDEVLRVSRFDEVLKRLKKDTSLNIAEKGVSLSGGEKQRLSVARGLLFAEGKDILCLDEPTSSVDSQIELTIFDRLFNQYEDKTIVASVHRLHLLTYFDTIYLFKNGKIMGHGSFESLKKTNEYFAHLWQSYKEASEDATLEFA